MHAVRLSRPERPLRLLTPARASQLDHTSLADVLSERSPERSTRKTSWQPLARPPKYEVKTEPRARPKNVKEQIVREREFKNIVLVSEDVAEMEYRPVACKKTYRLIVVRKNLSIERAKRSSFPTIGIFTI